VAKRLCYSKIVWKDK